MIYPKEFESKIGFDSLRGIVSDNCQSRMGKNEVENMSFSSDYGFVRHNLGCVAEMVGILGSESDFPCDNIHDIVPYLKEIKAQGSYLESRRLYQLLQMLYSFESVRSFFAQSADEEGETKKYPELYIDFGSLECFPGLISDISRVVNKYGEIKDDASDKLYEIRRSIRAASGSMQRAMRRILDRAVSQGIVDKDVTPSIRDGRLVIPVSAANKRSINGIVHDESATGKTIFIEPAEVVEAGNRMRELENEEKREIIAILVSVADKIRPYSDSVVESCLLLGRLDFIRAKALFAIDVDAQMPNLSDKVEMEWYHAVHPGLLISLRKHDRKVVPLDITLGGDKRILIISGPNAGGKSVCLKTVAVVQYMTQCGLLPTLYYNSHIGIFRNLFIDIGDEQSFENDLSTYSSHLKNMKYFLLHSDKKTLLLADEMGSGTEPQIGGALAQAILKQLGDTGCYGIVTTHYQNLKSFADETPGFVNGAMLYDRQHLQPTFQLSIGTAGSSFALDIASKIGLPKNVIEDAKDIVGTDYVNIDKYLSEITRDRRYWANKRQSIREKEGKLENLLSKYETSAGELKAQRNQIIRDAKAEAKEILSGANAQIERTILEIRNVQADKEKTKLIRKELEQYKKSVNEDGEEVDIVPEALKPLRHKSRKTQAPKQPEKKADDSIVVGDFVKLDGNTTVGKVISVDGKKVEVSFGNLRTIVDVKRLKKTAKPKESLSNQVSTISRTTEEASRRRQLNFSNEIDVRGMRADEAIQAVNYFMDDALQFNASRVRILHGTGHGILKSLIREQLRGISGVRSFYDEDVRFGGAGITVVDLDS